MILLDTNLLTRMSRSRDPRSGVARHAVHTLFARRERLVLVPQNLYEFWAVATRRPGASPAGQNGLGMTPAQAGQWLHFFRRRFVLLPDKEELPDIWQRLVQAHSLTGCRAHDIRLAAAMQIYSITALLTFNTADFRGLPITTIDPSSV